MPNIKILRASNAVRLVNEVSYADDSFELPVCNKQLRQETKKYG